MSDSGDEGKVKLVVPRLVSATGMHVALSARVARGGSEQLVRKRLVTTAQ